MSDAVDEAREALDEALGSAMNKEVDTILETYAAAIRAESAGTLDNLCSPYYERGWKAGAESAGMGLDVGPPDPRQSGEYQRGWRAALHAVNEFLGRDARLSSSDTER